MTAYMTINKNNQTVLFRFPSTLNTYDSVMELEARLKADDLSDIVTALSPESVKPYYRERLIDLSTFTFVDRYNISNLKQLTDERSIYLLPGPAEPCWWFQEALAMPPKSILLFHLITERLK